MKLTLSSILLIFLLAMAGPVSAQVATGTPPFGSFAKSSADTINLGNLNVHIDMPVLRKAGRGVPFNYDITYDSSIWQPVTSSGTTTWEPTNSGSLGWTFPALGGAGYYDAYIAGDCYTEVVGFGEILTGVVYAYLAGYTDVLATTHVFPGEVTVYTGSCGSGYYGTPGTATDGSGYSATIDSSGNLTVHAKNGTIVYYTNSSNSLGVPTETDSNGNQISVNSSNVFTDTLGTTALTVSGTAPNPTTFTYTSPSGANASYTMKYSSYTVKTNFQCSGIAEYGPTSQSLVSEIGLPDGTSYQFTYEPTPGYSGDVTGRLASVKLPTGGTISYTYSGGNNGITCADGSTATLTRQTPDGTWTYAHSESGTTWTTEQTDPLGDLTNLYFQSVSSGGMWESYETERDVKQLNNGTQALLKTTYTCYNGNTPSGSPPTCDSASITLPITEKTVYKQWPSGLESKVDTKYDSTGYGLVTEKDEYGYGTNSPGSLVRQTKISYASLGNGIVNRPSQISIYNGSGTLAAQTTYQYDQGSVTSTSGTPQHVSISGSRGNLTTLSYSVSGSTTLSKMFTYFDTGNAQTATDVNGAQASYTYGACGNSFVTSVSEPLGLSKSMAWNCHGGVETSVTDENGHIASVSYTDSYFWRPNSVTDQLSNVTNISYGGQTSVEAAMTFGSSTSDVLATVDGLGRPELFQVREGPGSSTFDSTQTGYDGDGRPNFTSLPFAEPSGQLCSGSCPGSTTSYDALGRPTSVTDSGGGTVSYTYTGNDVLTTAGPAPLGENTKRKQLEYDGLGRVTSVCEITGLTGSGTCSQTSSATGLWTTYTYDANNKLTGVTQNAQSSNAQTRAYIYDMLGRMTSETNPESGTTTYTYDSDPTCGTSTGDLVKKVDAAGNTICYAYDALHRMTTTTYSGTYASVTPNRYFVYDSATVNGVAMANAKSRRAEAYTCFSPCSTKLTDEGFSYTARGEVSDVYQSTPNSGGYAHVSQTYWANGTTNQISGLSGLPTITYGVDGEGRAYSAAASSGQNPLSSTNYNVASLPTQVNLGSSDSDSFAYDLNTGRMTQYSFNVNGQSVIGNLTWNALGTLASLGITDPFNSANTQTCSYSHDDLVRINNVNCGSIWSQSFSFDAFGNLSKSGTETFQPTYSYVTNQMTQVGGKTPSYDADGNVTNDFLHSYAWDANGRPVTIDGVNVTYDALGRMVEQNSGAYTQIVYAPSGGKLALMNGQTLSKGFVPLTGGALAVYNSSGLDHYRHSDWLGSNRLCSSPSRAVTCDAAYGPFGEPYAENGTADVSFTGMNQDTVSNLYDFPAREYGIQGRWPSPDPAGLASVNPADPQTWNRYAYVRNSPLMMIDPSGLDGCDMAGGEECMAGMISGPDQGGGMTLPTVSTTVYVTAPPDTTGCDQACIDLLTLGVGQPGSVSAPNYNPFSGLGSGGGGAAGTAPGNGGSGPSAPPPTVNGCLPAGAQGPCPQTPQQNYDQCMSAFNNSALGGIVSFFSVLNVASNLSEWLGLGGGKALGVLALDKAEASSAVTEYSITGGSVTDAAVLGGSEALGYAGAGGMAVATAMDATARAICSGQPPLMGPITPILP